MTSAVSTHMLLLKSILKEHDTQSVYPELDDFLQQWVDDIMIQSKKEMSVQWQEAIKDRTFESFIENTALWSQAVVQENQSSSTSPVMLLAIDDPAARIVIESFLGYQSMEFISASHQYTLFEQNLVERFCTKIINILSQTWITWNAKSKTPETMTFYGSSISNIAPSLGRSHQNVIAWPLTIRHQEDATYGTCYIIIPHITASFLLSKLQERFAGDSLHDNNLWHEHWQHTLSETLCDIEIHIPPIMCDLHDVLGWQEGSKISIPSMIVSHGYCHEQRIMTGSVGHKNGYMAFQMQSFDIYNERNDS